MWLAKDNRFLNPKKFEKKEKVVCRKVQRKDAAEKIVITAPKERT